MGDDFTTMWTCANDCLNFELIGTPTVCPYCGTTNIHPVDDDAESYDVPHRMIVKEHDES